MFWENPVKQRLKTLMSRQAWYCCVLSTHFQKPLSWTLWIFLHNGRVVRSIGSCHENLDFKGFFSAKGKTDFPKNGFAQKSVFPALVISVEAKNVKVLLEYPVILKQISSRYTNILCLIFRLMLSLIGILGILKANFSKKPAKKIFSQLRQVD